MKINEYFLALQKQMITRLSSERDIIFHPGTKGDATELNWLDWLRTYIPKRYCVDKAFIIDSEGSISDQIDLVVYDQHYSPFIFNQDGAIYVPAESIYAVFEIKQDLSKEYIEYAGKKMESVRVLKRTSKSIVHAGGVYKPRDLTPIIGGILTLSSIWSPPLGTAFEEAIGNLSGAQRIDIGCCLEYGAFKIDYSDRPSAIKSSSQASLISFFLDFLDVLQGLGTVSAIDLMEYKKGIKT
jgi:hypothetical protein